MVQNNLSAVNGVVTAKGPLPRRALRCKATRNRFSAADFKFGRIDFATLTEKDARLLLGEPTGDEWAQDDNRQWLHTLSWPDAALVFVTDENRENVILESITLNGSEAVGPRGLTLGMGMEGALSLFRCDGSGQTSGPAALLYGDGQTSPTATLERTNGDATARYTAQLSQPIGANRQAALHLTFVDKRLAEIMLYIF